MNYVDYNFIELNTLGHLPKKLPKVHSLILEKYEYHFNLMISKHKENFSKYFKDIYAAIIDDAETNAVAFNEKGREYIGINAGLAFSVPVVFTMLLRGVRFFPKLEVSNRLSNDEISILLDLLRSKGRFSQKNYSIYQYLTVEVGSVSTRVIDYMSFRVWDFITLHEIAHIERCHIEFLNSLFSTNGKKTTKLLEFGSGVDNIIAETLRFLEVDADFLAAKSQISAQTIQGRKYISEFLNVSEGRILNWNEVLFFWLLSLITLFQILALKNENEDGVNTIKKHPLPYVRLNIIATLSRKMWKDVIPEDSEYSKTVDLTQRAFKKIWLNSGLPITNTQKKTDYEKIVETNREKLVEDLFRHSGKLDELTLNRTKNKNDSQQ